MDRALKTGGTAPLFTLPDEREQPVSTSEILAKGPLVLHFYRGMW
jgi:peroxiredoxin